MTAYSIVFLLFLFRVYLAYPTGNVTSRELTAEDEEVLFHILTLKASEIGSIVETGRKFLQRTRQWQASHPAESRLVHCVVRYCIDSKIPGLVSATDGDNDGRRGLSLPVPMQESRTDLSAEILEYDERPFRADTVKHAKYLFKRKALKALYLTFIYFRELFSQYKLLGCTFQYMLSKFWEWVDSAS